jgi:hypothetical protein
MPKRFIALLEMPKGQGIEAPRFFYAVESRPYLVGMDFVVSWASGVCRTSALQLLSAQRLIVPFKSYSPFPSASCRQSRLRMARQTRKPTNVTGVITVNVMIAPCRRLNIAGHKGKEKATY